MEQTAERKPHICLYIGSLQKGGAERVMTHLAEYLYGEGWKVTFVTTYFRPPEYVLPHALWDAETGEPYGTEEETVAWGKNRTVTAGPDGIYRIYSDPAPEELAKGRVPCQVPHAPGHLETGKTGCHPFFYRLQQFVCSSDEPRARNPGGGQRPVESGL